MDLHCQSDVGDGAELHALLEEEATSMARKREMTTELTNSAWSILADYHREVQETTLSRIAAIQERAGYEFSGTG